MNTQHIVDLETRFWQAMVDKDADGAAYMIAENALLAGPQGTMTIDPDKYRQMTNEGTWTLDRFKLSNVEVVFPADDTAVIAYTVHQTGEMGEQPMDLTCADSTTWVRQNGDWKCALHTETVLEQA